jgi:hypothetical protein
VAHVLQPHAKLAAMNEKLDLHRRELLAEIRAALR